MVWQLVPGTDDRFVDTGGSELVCARGRAVLTLPDGTAREIVRDDGGDWRERRLDGSLGPGFPTPQAAADVVREQTGTAAEPRTGGDAPAGD